MRRGHSLLMAGVMAVGVPAHAQGGDAEKILGAARQALGGDQKLTTVKSLTATGHNSRGDVEVAIELPDKFIKKEVFAQMNDTALSRTLGFNGAGLIDEADAPPQMNGMGGGNMVIRMSGPGMAGGVSSATAKASTMTAARRDFARLALGIFATSFTAYPLHVTAAGQADSAEGQADVIEVKSDDGFTGRLFVSAQTHLPIMLTWMDKEPLVMTMGGPPGGRAGAVPSTSGNTVVTGGPGGGTFTQVVPGSRGPMTPEERDKLMQEAQARAAEAEANRRVVEYRITYGDYKEVDGIKIPFTISRSMDGKSQDALTLDRVRINPKIDPKKFEISK